MSCIPTSTRFKSRSCGLFFLIQSRTALFEEPYTSRATLAIRSPLLTVRTVTGTAGAGSDVSGDGGDCELGVAREALGYLTTQEEGFHALPLVSPAVATYAAPQMAS